MTTIYTITEINEDGATPWSVHYSSLDKAIGEIKAEMTRNACLDEGEALEWSDVRGNHGHHSIYESISDTQFLITESEFAG